MLFRSPVTPWLLLAAAVVVAAAVAVVFVAAGVTDAEGVGSAALLADAVAFFVATGFALFVVAAAVATAFVEVAVDDEAAAVVVVPVEPIAAPPAILIEPLDVS